MTSQPEYILAGVLMKQHLSSSQTSGRFSLFENRSSGQSKTPIHVHANDDETLYVLEGEMWAIIAGLAERVAAGDSVFLPRGTAHQLVNRTGAVAHYLLLCTPGGFEGFLAEAGHLRTAGEMPQAPSPMDLERLEAAAPHYGITLLTDWPDPADGTQQGAE